MENLTQNTHHGHRKRLRELIDKVGLKNLSDIQIMEQILSMCFLRKDTNIIAHSLLNKFGSISEVLDASILELMEVDGVGKSTAQMITYLPQIFEIYNKDKTNKLKTLVCNTYGDVYIYFSSLFKNLNKEEVFIAFVNKKNHFCGYEKLSDGNFAQVDINPLELSKSIIKHDATKVIIAHNHPNGDVTPSKIDYDTHQKLSNILTMLNIELFDNIVIDKNGFFSIKNGIYMQTKKED